MPGNSVVNLLQLFNNPNLNGFTRQTVADHYCLTVFSAAKSVTAVNEFFYGCSFDFIGVHERNRL